MQGGHSSYADAYAAISFQSARLSLLFDRNALIFRGFAESRGPQKCVILVILVFSSKLFSLVKPNDNAVLDACWGFSLIDADVAAFSSLLLRVRLVCVASGGSMGVRDFALRIRSGTVGLVSAVLSLAAFLVGQPLPVMAQYMTLPGKASVDPNGGAGYTIPISVPPGTAGMAPTLHFQYNNQSGNGLLGIGWSLAGLPAVGRCPQTIAQDGMLGAVTYTASDRFCLDGQRLFAINNGTYGGDGTEYHTEIESFSRVISHGTAGTGPAWFEVHTKSGQILEFGNTADSQVLAQGKPTVRSWGVDKVSDTKGNYFTVTYTQDTTNGQAYPARIDYTGNAGASLQPYNSVQFAYVTRPDVTALYNAGSVMETTQRLTDVKTYAGSNLVADYRLGYNTAIPNPSVLQSITVCAGDGSCLPPTSFTVTNSMSLSGPAPTFAYPSSVGTNGNVGAPPTTHNDPFTGDFNGDGKTDFAFAAQSGVSILLSNGDGTFSQNAFPWPSGQSLSDPPDAAYNLFVGDFNGDGKTDFAYAGSTSLYVYAGNGDGTFSSSTFVYPSSVPNPNSLDRGSLGSPPGAFNLAFTGDFNGDGKSDIAFATDTWLCLFLSNGDGTFAISTVNWPNGWYFGNPPQAAFWLVVGDFDGDGKTDFALTGPAGGQALYMFRSNGDGTFSGSQFSYAFSIGGPGGGSPIVGDFNGDGLTDVIFPSPDGSSGYVLLSKGDGTFATSTITWPMDLTNLGWTWSSTYTPIVADFNGDGKTDIALPTATTVFYLLGNGDGTFSLTEFTNPNGWNFGAPPSANYTPVTGDFNGDGKVDFGFAGETQLYMLLGTSAPPNFLLNTATNGLGATTTFTYQPLTNGSVYTKSGGSFPPGLPNPLVYPYADVLAPIYVVSRIDTSNGIGGNLSVSYAYAGARTDRSGRGFLDFRQVTATDLQTNVVKNTTYRQDYPYTALVESETQSLNGVTLTTTNNTYGSTALGGTRYQVFLAESKASSTDLDGSALPTITTSYQYDNFGNATQVAVSASDGHSKTTTNTYTNDDTNWLLGRLTTASVTSVAPSPPSPSTPAAPTIMLSPASLPNATYGASSYNQTVMAVGGTLPYTYTVSAGSLPGGLALDPSTGALSGAPTGAGTSNFTITATDANKYTGSQVYSLTVVACGTGATTTTVLTLGSNWTVPSNWCSLNNKIEVIGGGGGGGEGPYSGTDLMGGGGGGGGYSKVTNVSASKLIPGTNVTYHIGSGGSGAACSLGNVAGNAGGDTYLCNSTSNCDSIGGAAVIVGARGGQGANGGTGGLGGQQNGNEGGVGALMYLGGNGGTGLGFGATGGGGGAAGPLGNGGNGGGNGVWTVADVGSGGGGNGGGSAGLSSASLSYNGGAGGNNIQGTGGGAGAETGGGLSATNAANGTNGGGGGGGSYFTDGYGEATGVPGAGGNGTEWNLTAGSGGGGGGGTIGDGANGGLYGGGGGGSMVCNTGKAGNGTQGVMVITYAP